MNIIKPIQQGLLYRTFVKERRFYLGVASLSFFPFHNPVALGTEQEIWETVSSACYREMIFDECMPKARGEVFMIGKCFAPDRAPVTRLYVDLDFGPILKRVVVTGDRFWKRGEVSENFLGRIVGRDWEMSAPAPFTEMDIGWKNALGGEDFPENPLGKGFLATDRQPGLDNKSPLPNVERPERMMSAMHSVAEPAGYGPIDVTWPQRARLAGKQYGKRWEKERFPELAEDMAPAYYNMAPDDQQLEQGFWAGDEGFVITHMHPDHPEQQSALPGIRPRAFALQRHLRDERWREIPLCPETVWLFPNIERGILVSRGVLEIDTFYGVDVDTLLLAWELRDGASRSSDDYRRSVALREASETAADWTSREDDLSPPEGIPEEPDFFVDEDDAAGGPLAGPAVDRAVDKANGILDRAREMLKSAGVDPAEYLAGVAVAPPPLPEVPQLRKMSDIGKIQEWAKLEIAKAEKETADLVAKSRFGNLTTQKEARKVVEARAREICAKAGEDFDKLKVAAAENPPSDESLVARIKKLIAKAKAEVGDDPEKAAALDKALARVEAAEPKMAAAQEDEAAMLRESAHYMDPDLPDAERARYLRDWAVAQHARLGSLAELDLTGVDLSGLDLRGADFKGANLHSAKLCSCSLSGADLSEAILARADFKDADLAGARLCASGLGQARFTGAQMSRADLSGAAIDQTGFAGATLTGAALRIELCQESDFSGADLSGVALAGAQFLKSRFDKATLAGAALGKVSFMECSLTEADFSGADLEEASFIEVDARSARFDGAKMKNANAHMDSKFAECSFRRIDGVEVNFGQTNLVGADFTGADLIQAAFGESSLNFAVFSRAVAREADFTDADLSDASFECADLMQSSLQGVIALRTRFSGANLFAADLMHARLEDVALDGARIKRTLLEGE